MATGPKSAVYMDACCFIDIAKQKLNVPLTTQRANDVWHCRQLLLASRNGTITVYTSTLTIAECQHGGDGTGTAPKAVQDLFYRLLMSGQFVVLVQLTPFIAADARDLRWKHGINLRGADAVHLASALDRGCTEFITTDEAINRPKIKNALSTISRLGLNVIRASDTKVLPGSYRQGNLLTGQDEL